MKSSIVWKCTETNQINGKTRMKRKNRVFQEWDPDSSFTRSFPGEAETICFVMSIWWQTIQDDFRIESECKHGWQLNSNGTYSCRNFHGVFTVGTEIYLQKCYTRQSPIVTVSWTEIIIQYSRESFVFFIHASLDCPKQPKGFKKRFFKDAFSFCHEVPQIFPNAFRVTRKNKHVL